MNWVLIAALYCHAPTLTNLSKEPWTSHDREVIKFTHKRCGEIYPISPCLSRFIKLESNRYRVYCQEKK